MPVKIRRPSGRPSHPQLIAEDTLSNIALDLIEWMKAHDRVATGNSLNWEVRIKRVGNLTPKDIDARLLGAAYIGYALFGRDPGDPPPVSKILAWMKVRGIRGRDIRGRFKNDREAAKAIAFSIAEQGISSQTSTITQSFIDELTVRNLDNAIEKYVPEMGLSTATELLDRFEEGLQNLANIKVDVR